MLSNDCFLCDNTGIFPDWLVINKDVISVKSHGKLILRQTNN